MVALVVVGAERLSHEYLRAFDAELLERDLTQVPVQNRDEIAGANVKR